MITADVYGAGDADRAARARARRRSARAATASWARSATTSTRASATAPKGFPRFTDPRCAGPSATASYLRMATERSLERCGVERFDVLLLHNPDRIGYTSEAVWEGMAALRERASTRMLGVAPGPANGFTLDVIGCLERFGELIDWAMIILNPLEPWPGELVLGAAAATACRRDHARRRLRRPVPRRRAPRARVRRAATTAASGPPGWVRGGPRAGSSGCAPTPRATG